MKIKLLFLLTLAVVALHAEDTLKTTTLQRYYMPVRLFLEGATIVMPADKYDFKLTPAQMSYAQWIKHSAGDNYRDCAIVGGDPNPVPQAQVDQLKTKEEMVKAMRDSFKFCDAEFAKIDDQKILSSPQMIYTFLHISIHNNEVYGNMVGYMRASGIVPPSTEITQKMMKSKMTPEQVMKELTEKYDK